MDKKTAGLLGAMGALVTAMPAIAASTDAAPILQAASYADLLKPIPNALAALAVMDSSDAGPARVVLVQFHHHHHRHRFRRHFRRHHHDRG